MPTSSLKPRPINQRSAPPSPSPPHGSNFWALIAVLVIALLLGGGGQRYGLANLVVQLAALLALALHPGAARHFWQTAPISLKVLGAATLLLPLLQIIPLPFSLWKSLPGRAMIAPSLEMIGESDWAPWSFDPRRTLLALSGLITPIALLILGWSLRRDQLVLLAWGLAGLGLIVLAVGIFQLSSNEPLTLWTFETYLPGVLLGTFANRNSAGLFLVAALGFAALTPLHRTFSAALPVRLALMALLLFAIILTQSRTSLVLAAIPLGLAALKAILWARTQEPGQKPNSKAGKWQANPVAMAGGGLALAGLMLASVLLIAPGRVADTLERFETLENDARAFYWQDAAFASSRYWPVGVGMGNFDEVFQLDESLEHVTERRAMRAHNDYLELTIEAGIAGLALAASWAALLLWFSWRARTSHMRWLAFAASSFFLVVAGQSLTDYPLRNQTMLALAGLCIAFLARLAFPSQTSKESAS